MTEFDSHRDDEGLGLDWDASSGDSASSGVRPLFPWERLLYAIAFTFVAWGVFWILIALAIVQFLLLLLQAVTPTVTGHPSSELRRFNVRMLQYLLELLAYITFVRNALPFPFSPFPSAPAQRPHA